MQPRTSLGRRRGAGWSQGPGRAPLPCTVRSKKAAPQNSPPPQKAKPDQQLHILRLALSFPLRKCHLFPLQI